MNLDLVVLAADALTADHPVTIGLLLAACAAVATGAVNFFKGSEAHRLGEAQAKEIQTVRERVVKVEAGQEATTKAMEKVEKTLERIEGKVDRLGRRDGGEP
jgi:hypothetical protein